MTYELHRLFLAIIMFCTFLFMRKGIWGLANSRATWGTKGFLLILDPIHCVTVLWKQICFMSNTWQRKKRELWHLARCFLHAPEARALPAPDEKSLFKGLKESAHTPDTLGRLWERAHGGGVEMDRDGVGSQKELQNHNQSKMVDSWIFLIFIISL